MKIRLVNSREKGFTLSLNEQVIHLDFINLNKNLLDWTKPVLKLCIRLHVLPASVTKFRENTESLSFSSRNKDIKKFSFNRIVKECTQNNL